MPMQQSVDGLTCQRLRAAAPTHAKSTAPRFQHTLHMVIETMAAADKDTWPPLMPMPCSRQIAMPLIDVDDIEALACAAFTDDVTIPIGQFKQVMQIAVANPAPQVASPDFVHFVATRTQCVDGLPFRPGRAGIGIGRHVGGEQDLQGSPSPCGFQNGAATMAITYISQARGLLRSCCIEARKYFRARGSRRAIRQRPMK